MPNQMLSETNTAPRDISPDVLNLVGENTSLSAEAKETSMTWGRVDDAAMFHTDEAGVIRRMLPHPHIDILKVGVYCGTTDEGNMDVRRFETIEEAAECARTQDGHICELRAMVPIGLIRIGKKPRKSSSGADAVTFDWRNALKSTES